MTRKGIAGAVLVRDEPLGDEHSWRWAWRAPLGVVCAVVVAAMIIATIPAASADSISTERGYPVSGKSPDATNKGDIRYAPIPETKLRDLTDRGGMANDSEHILVRVIHDGRGFEGTSVDQPAWTQGFEDTNVKDAVASACRLCSRAGPDGRLMCRKIWLRPSQPAVGSSEPQRRPSDQSASRYLAPATYGAQR